jgi:hypothetical protein
MNHDDVEAAVPDTDPASAAADAGAPPATAGSTEVPPPPADPRPATTPDDPRSPATRPPEARAAADDAPRPAEPVSESNVAVTDPAGLSASEAAAAKRAETAAAVALVAAVAAERASEAASAAAVATPVVEEAPPKPGVTRRLRAVGAMLIRGAAVLALFVGGLALGNAAFQSNQPPQPAQVVDPATDGVEPPAVVREFIGALSSGDADALRSSLQAEPHARLTSEFRRFDIQQITEVETLGTHVDGTRSATEVVMQGTTTTGVPISINLVILTDGNTIEGFR